MTDPIRTPAEALEAAAQVLEERGSDGWAEHIMAEYASVMAESIRALASRIAAPDDEALARAVAAEAERDALRDALEDHACGCKRQCVDCAVAETTGVIDNGWKARAVLDALREAGALRHE